MNKTRFNVFYLLIALFGVLTIHDMWDQYRTVEVIPYSHFEELLDAGKIESVSIGANDIRGKLKEAEDGKTRFITTRVPVDLASRLDGKGVEFEGRVESELLPTILSWVIPMLLFVALWMFLIRRMGSRGSQLLSIGKSRAKVYVETDTEVTFEDVAGVDEAKAELQEIVQFLRAPEEHGRLGARMPKGVLLVGPPGTGKTLLARAVAGEAGVPFFSISGSEFVEMFVGVGAARVRDLFEQAQQKAPCIVFIDELDALGRARSAMGPMGGHDEKEQTLNQLLVELDGFDPAKGIVLLGATNRPEILDPALLRAGRFDRQVLVDRPDKPGRLAILKVHSKKVRLAPGTDLEQVAALTPGFTGADLANLVNEAALAATRRNGDAVTLADFNIAIERIVAGLEKRNRILNPHEREIVAHHEMGHAIVAASLPSTDPVHKISIIPRGLSALGYTMQRPTEDRFLMTQSELEERMAVLLGGRAAEMRIFEHLSTGAADDLAKATELARSMVTRYAMSEKLGQVVYESESPSYLGQAARQREFSEETAREIDCAVRELTEKALQRAVAILARNDGVLRSAAATLLAQETLSGEALADILSKVAESPPA